MEEIMTAKESDARPATDPDATLETALIEAFLQTRGLDSAAVRALPHEEATRILTLASVFASDKLAEVESRAQFVHEIHGGDRTQGA
jgi:hypothetical protein